MTWTPDSHMRNAAGYLVRHQKQRERRGAVEALAALNVAVYDWTQKVERRAA